MKRIAALGVVALMIGSAHAADVGVSINISQPGVYGRIDIGRFPQPVLVMQEPVVVMRPPMVVAQPEPMYLWVPPGHRKNWRRYCGRYNACGAPVYFVQDRWYRQNVLAPARYERSHGQDQGRQWQGDRGREGGKDHGERGHGKDHGKDHGGGRGD